MHFYYGSEGDGQIKFRNGEHGLTGTCKAQGHSQTNTGATIELYCPFCCQSPRIAFYKKCETLLVGFSKALPENCFGRIIERSKLGKSLNSSDALEQKQ